MRQNNDMEKNWDALISCQRRIQILVARAEMLTINNPARSNASYRDASQLEMLHNYLHRITFNLPH